ncbi:MAG: RNA pseudouridine synthase [Treponema sp.]|nr:RNA pseudouridine synthase [Treponema sp.]
MNDLLSRILFQNNACIVINKLKGEAVEGAKDSIVNLPQEIKSFLNNDFTEAVHRLDVPVTGCALFALDKSSAAFLTSAFKGENSITVEKRYWAIIEKPKKTVPESGELNHWIEINAKQNKSYAYNEDGAGRKKASLRYKIKGEGTNYLFAEIELLTGRHHQIRAQLAAIGLHIKGDLKYGAKRSEKGGGIRLHARSLSFPNPLNKTEKISVTAEPPETDNLWISLTRTFEQ